MELFEKAQLDSKLGRWLRAQQPRCDWAQKRRWDETTCKKAAETNRLDIVILLRSQDPPCPWDERTCAYAAANGGLDILQWSRSQNPPCPWDKNTCEYAARYGWLNILQWARSQDPPCPWDQEECLFTAKTCMRLDVVKWITAQGDEKTKTKTKTQTSFPF